MKTKFSLLYLVSCILFLVSFPVPSATGQIPQGFNYQAIARDGTGAILPNTSLQVMLTIQSSSSGGTIFWKELFSSVNTNTFGLFSLVVGTGIRQSESTVATFDLIDWSVTPKYLKTEVYTTGPWLNMGTSQLYSVPYAMNAKSLTGVDKLNIKGTTSNLNEALFEVKNKDGQTVFAVYNEGVRIYVSDGKAKGQKGGFAVGGFGTDAKAGESTKYLFVSKDSVRVWLDSDTLTKGAKGTFAVGGYDLAKGKPQDYLKINPYSTNIYVKPSAKGLKGGFNVGGYDAKGTTLFTSLTPDNYFIGHSSGQYTTGIYNSFYGYETGAAPSSGQNNIFLGYQAGRLSSGGSYNVFLGNRSGESNKGDNNIFVGYLVGVSNSTGMSNVFMGTTSGVANTTGTANVFIGVNSGNSNQDGGGNVFVGASSGSSNINGGDNIFLGSSSGYFNQGGNANIFIGNQSGLNNITGHYNVFLGLETGYSNTSSFNTYIGYKAGRNYTTGSYNTFIGYQAGLASATSFGTGDKNIALGYNAGYKITSGYNNVLIGVQSAQNLTSGFDNILLGNQAGNSLTGGDSNVAIGLLTGAGLTTNSLNVLVGEKAGFSLASGTHNLFLGPYAGYLTNGPSENTFVGYDCGYSNVSGVGNTYLGWRAGRQTHGSYNVFIGRAAGMNEDGSYKLYIDQNSTPDPLIYGDFTDGSEKLAFNGLVGIYTKTPGYTLEAYGTNASLISHYFGQARGGISALSGGRVSMLSTANTDDLVFGYSSTTPMADFSTNFVERMRIDNSAGFLGIGTTSPQATLHIKGNAGVFNIEGTDQCYIQFYPAGFSSGRKGYFGFPAAGSTDISLTNQNTNGNIVLSPGSGGYVKFASYSSGTGTTLVADASGNIIKLSSDARLKDNITPLQNSLDKVLSMQGVNFTWLNDPTKTIDIGFIAQDVEKVVPELIVKDNNDGLLSVKYQNITALLVESVKEQQKQIESLKATVDKLEALVKELTDKK